MLYHVTMRSPVQVDCQLVDAEPGDRMKAQTVATGWVAGNSGQRLCELDTTSCALSGAGPHRIVSVGNWNATPSNSYSVWTTMVSDARAASRWDPASTACTPPAS